MVWSAPRTWVANVTAITAAALNTDLRDNLNYLKGLLDGTGPAINVTLPAGLVFPATIGTRIVLYGDGLNRYQIGVESGATWLMGDGGIRFYDDADTPASSPPRLALDTATGKLTGTGFFDSGATAI